MNHVMSKTGLISKVLAAAMLLIAVCLVPTGAEATQFKRVRDVNVSCSNALSCDIYITNPRVTLQTIGFRRAAAPGAAPAFFMVSREPLTRGSSVTLTVDSEEIVTIASDEFSYRAATSEYLYRDEMVLPVLLSAVRAGTRLQISYVTKRGRSSVPFSLSGMTAGFIFADEAQGRVGRDDGLIAISSSQNAQSTDQDAGDVVQYKTWGDVPEPLLAYFGNEFGRCDNEAGASSDEIFGGFEAPLDENTSLIGLPCGTPGAYNISFSFWLKVHDAFRPIALPSILDDGPSATDYATNASWDHSKGELTAFHKGRGLGDCGLFSRWNLIGNSGFYSFVLLEEKLKDECDGVYKEDLSDYQQLWPLP